tara:strand:+ start:1655 stop:2578 length:924 start_codon:yes stop_codon:yes gene_type:complete
MAYSAAALASAETTGFSADKPLMVVQQADNPSEAHWTTTGNLTGTDVTLAAEPAARAYDDIGNLVTSTTGVAATSPKYYGFTFSTAISFDTLLLTGHNFNSISITSVALEIADDAAFSTNKIEIAKYTISGAVDNRILITNLNSAGGSSTYSAGGTAQRYSGVEYARLVVTHSGSKDPELGEILLGYRYQLQRNPDLPWDNKAQSSMVTDFASNSGMLKRYVLNRGKAARSFSSSMGASAEIAVIDAWYAAIEEGTRNFVYIETPSTSAQAYLMAMVDASLSFPLVGPFERVLEFGMTEQPPFLARE